MRSMMPNSDSMSAPRLSETDAMNRAASWAELGLPAAAPGPLIGFGPFSNLCSDIHWLPRPDCVFDGPHAFAASPNSAGDEKHYGHSAYQSFGSATSAKRLRFSVTVPTKRER